MRVLFLKDDSDHRAIMWEVHDGAKWWTATWSVEHGGWMIMAGKTGHEVEPHGRLGKRIIAAIKASDSATLLGQPKP